MYPFHYPYYVDQRQTNKLIKDIEKAINGEYNAIQCYEKLAQLARTEKERKQILEIREDEQNHAVWFLYFLVNLNWLRS